MHAEFPLLEYVGLLYHYEVPLWARFFPSPSAAPQYILDLQNSKEFQYAPRP